MSAVEVDNANDERPVMLVVADGNNLSAAFENGVPVVVSCALGIITFPPDEIVIFVLAAPPPIPSFRLQSAFSPSLSIVKVCCSLEPLVPWMFKLLLGS